MVQILKWPKIVKIPKWPKMVKIPKWPKMVKILKWPKIVKIPKWPKSQNGQENLKWPVVNVPRHKISKIGQKDKIVKLTKKSNY